MANQLRYVSSDYLLALIPSSWELLAKMLWIPSVMVAASQTALWLSHVTKNHRFTLIAMSAGWAVFVVTFSVWLRLYRSRIHVLKSRQKADV